jgi:hypothetical protein
VAEQITAKIQNVKCKMKNEKLEIEVVVENLGVNTFTGTLKIETGFFSTETTIELEKGLIGTYTFELKPNASMGTYTANAQILYNGNLIDETKTTFTLEPDFEISYQPKAFNIGEIGTFTFFLKNTGTCEGKISLWFNVDALDFEDIKTLWIKPNETETVDFSVIIPDDLEDKDYKGVLICKWQGIGKEREKEEKIWFHINGIKIIVSAELDNVLYNLGDLATLTLRIKNINQGTLSMSAKVKFSETEGTKSFELSPYGSQTILFPINISGFSEKVFYGVYSLSGRAIHLNSIYLYEKGEGISLYTDKQAYNAGAMVNLYIFTDFPGTLTLKAPDYSITQYLELGTHSYSFVLPDNLFSGTYYISYEFGTISGEYRFDVYGIEVKTLRAKLDKQAYRNQDQIKASLFFEANRSISCILKGWIKDPTSEHIKVFEEETELIDGENELSPCANISILHAGLHYLVYGLYLKDSKLKTKNLKLKRGIGILEEEEEEDEALLAYGSLGFDGENYQHLFYIRPCGYCNYG